MNATIQQQAMDLLVRIQEAISVNTLILPSLPEVALRVRELSHDALCPLHTFEHELAKDAAIAARVLKVANSAALRRSNPANTLKQAIASLGVELVCSLVTQLSILQTMQSCKDRGRLRDFVASSLRISELCYGIALQQKHLNAELATLAGLLHDIGKLPLRDFLLAQKDLTSTQRIQFEIMLHPNVGAILLKNWQMPDELVQVVRYHEQIMRTSPSSLPDYVDVVISANLLHYGTEKGRYAKYLQFSIPALEKCKKGQQDLKSTLDLQDRKALSLALINA